MIKTLAQINQQNSPSFRMAMEQINSIARRASLREYTTFSRIWEYPFLWLQLEPVQHDHLRILDIGSADSPLPWFIATKGFHVCVSDMSARYWGRWKQSSRGLGIAVEKRVLDARSLHLPTASLDICLSASVIEHIPDKTKAVTEVARVLKPGGSLVMTSDICEPTMGMTFPEWNGRALSMQEFDQLFRDNPWFETGLSELPWNVQDIPEYLAWNRTTAPHHNYVVAGSVVRRNSRCWEEPAWKDRGRVLVGNSRTIGSYSKYLVKEMIRPIYKRASMLRGSGRQA